MHWLLIETSGKVGQLALTEGNQIRVETHLDQAQKHARDLAPQVQRMLKELGWQPGQIDAVLVSLGPGSYTGLRVGLISAKVFAWSVGCRLLGLPTFEVLAWQARSLSSTWQVIEDAQQQRLYVQSFHIPSAPEGPRALDAMTVQPVANWLESGSNENQNSHPEGWVIGPGLPLVHDRLPSHRRIAPSHLWKPQLTAMLELGQLRLATGQSDSPRALEPLYFRSSSAEEQWKKLGR